MTDKHLLFWIFDYLVEKHPDALFDMKDNIKGNGKNPWVRESFSESFEDYKKASLEK